MRSLSKHPRVTLLALGALLAICFGVAYFARQSQFNKRVAIHSRAETRGCLVAFVNALQRTLADNGTLALPQHVTNGIAVSISPDALSNAISDFRETQGEQVAGTNILDNWHNPIKFDLSLLGFFTNVAGQLSPRVLAKAYSFGANGRDDGGFKDDIVFQKELVLTEAVIGGPSIGSSNQLERPQTVVTNALFRLRRGD